MDGFWDNFLTPKGVDAAAKATGEAVSGDWQAAAQTLGQQAVRKVTIQSQVSPPVEVDPFAQAPPGGAPNPIMMLVKPAVTIESPGGARTTIAPWGMPSENYLPWLVASVVVLFFGVTGALAYAFSRSGR